MPNKIIVYLQNISDKVSVKQVNVILENRFSNALAIKDFQRRTSMYTLKEIVFNENELSLLSNRFKK